MDDTWREWVATKHPRPAIIGLLTPAASALIVWGAGGGAELLRLAE